MMRYNRRLTAAAFIASAFTATSLAYAGPPSLNGQTVTVSLLESGYSPAVDVVTAGPGGPQIVGNNFSDPIGSILFADESVNLQDLQIVYNMEGGGSPYTGGASQCSGALGCSLWGSIPDDARFQFSGLSFGSPGVILQSVSLTTNDVYGVQVADVTATSFEVIFGSAGVLNGINGVPALGTITLDLVTAAVPEPSTYVLMLAGLLLVAGWRYRTRLDSHGF
jgi:PEP-CTERM motif